MEELQQTVRSCAWHGKTKKVPRQVDLLTRLCSVDVFELVADVGAQPRPLDRSLPADSHLKRQLCLLGSYLKNYCKAKRGFIT